jgi:hypothetical protein
MTITYITYITQSTYAAYNPTTISILTKDDIVSYLFNDAVFVFVCALILLRITDARRRPTCHRDVCGFKVCTVLGNVNRLGTYIMTCYSERDLQSSKERGE